MSADRELFSGRMTREKALTELRAIAKLRGNETLPNENVIDLAQAVLTLLGEPIEPSSPAIEGATFVEGQGINPE